jgi:hypothetical protein
MHNDRTALIQLSKAAIEAAIVNVDGKDCGFKVMGTLAAEF